MSGANPIVTLLVGGDGWIAGALEGRRKAAEEWVQLRADEREPGRFYQELRSYSFFGNTRTVCIERVDKLVKDEQLELDEALKGIAPTVELILTAGPTKAGEAWQQRVEAMEKAAVVKEAGGAGGVRQAAAAAGVALEDDLMALLKDQYPDQPLKLQRELEKLSLFAGDAPVGMDAWRELAVDAGMVDGWAFARSVLGRDLKAAEQILSDWSARGGSGHSAGRDLLGAMGYVLRQHLTYKLHLARGANPREASRRTPGRFGRGDEAANRGWSVAQLAAALSALVELDRELKSSRIPAELALYHWCVKAAAADQGAA